MPNFIIKTSKGFYRESYLNNFVKSAENAHVFEDIVDAFDVLEALRKDQVKDLQMIELNPVDDDLIDLARTIVREAEANAALNPSSKEIQVVIVEPMKKPFKKTIPNHLDAMHEIVDGYIENVFIGETKTGCRIGCVINEEGKLIGLPFNREIVNFDILVGSFFITAYNLEGDNVSLSDAECDVLIRKFSTNEVYL